MVSLENTIKRLIWPGCGLGCISAVSNWATLKAAFQAFIDALTQKVEARKTRICLNTGITGIVPQPDGTFHIKFNPTTSTAGPQVEENLEIFDRVLATVSPRLLSQLVPTLPDKYLASLKQLKSMGAVVLILAIKHQLTEQHYWINLPKSEGFPFLALVEHTNFIDRKHYDNDHIIYCGDYLNPDHEYFFSK